jgi:hypothetical protein
MAQGIGRCFGAVGTGGLGEDVAYMAGDGTEADTEDVGDVPIALAGGKEAEHFNLALTEIVEEAERGGCWSWSLLKVGAKVVF